MKYMHSRRFCCTAADALSSLFGKRWSVSIASFRGITKICGTTTLSNYNSNPRYVVCTNSWLSAPQALATVQYFVCTHWANLAWNRIAINIVNNLPDNTCSVKLWCTYNVYRFAVVLIKVHQLSPLLSTRVFIQVLLTSSSLLDSRRCSQH